MINFPIVIFSYNRPDHLNNLLNSIKLNKDILRHKIYLFCDGPRNLHDQRNINLIKDVIEKSKISFHQICFNNENHGLSKSIINGVNKVLNEHKACMIFEDDLVIRDSAIQFINFFLNQSYEEYNLGSVSAYSYIDGLKTSNNFDYYISHRHCSWGWGTWSNIWNKIEWDNIQYEKHFKDKNKILNLSKGGNDLNLLLWGHYKNYIDSWAIRFNLFCSQNNLLSLHSRNSLVQNFGKDNTGTHERFNFFNKFDKVKHNFIFDDKSFSKTKIFKSKNIDNFIKYSHRRSIKLLLFYVLNNLFSLFKNKN